jgi:hypothetical protein
MSDAINIDATITREEVFPARVEKRDERPVLVPRNPSDWLTGLGKMVGFDVLVRIERPKKHSDAQRAYYRGVVLVDVLSGLRALAREVGETCPIKDTDHLHEFFKALFLPAIVGPIVVTLPGANASIEMLPDTTTILTSAQYASYIDHITRWAGERSIPVRQPGEEVVA